MQMNRDEALDILRKWSAENVRIQCHSSVNQVEASVVGQLTVTDSHIKVRSDDGLGELILPLFPALEFGYEQPQAFPDLDCAAYECFLVAGLPDGNTITFSEIKGEE